MKILIVHTFYKISGGEDVVFANEADLLSERFEIKKISFHNGENPLASIVKFLLSPFNIFSYLKFKKILKIEKPDLVHVHNWHFGASPLIFRAARKQKIPVIHTLHNYRLLCPSATLFLEGKIFTKSLDEKFPWTAVSKKVYRNSALYTFWLACTIWIHKKLGTWKQVDHFIALTPFARDLFLDSGLGIKKRQISLKPNFTNDNGYNEGKREDHFLYVGRLAEEKGMKTLLDAFAGSEYNLIIAGDGPLKKLVQETENKCPNISYVGVKPNTEITELMKKSSALIFPSIWYEGMPMTLLEAFSTGTPVLASKLGAMENIVIDGYNGLHFESGNADNLLSKMGYWHSLGDEEKQIMSLHARSSYEKNYSPQKNLEEITTIYNQVVSPMT
ncbi:MAG: glycosyltransferase family 4 protein [Bacteroidetes bacterium]|nr:glycosyltransferase family 4 protein [Bacteroidota bacterium]